MRSQSLADLSTLFVVEDDTAKVAVESNGLVEGGAICSSRRDFFNDLSLQFFD